MSRRMVFRLGNPSMALMLLGLKLTAKLAIKKEKPIPWFVGPVMLRGWLRHHFPVADALAGEYLTYNKELRTKVMSPENAQNFLSEFDKIWKAAIGLPIRIDVEYDPVYADDVDELMEEIGAVPVGVVENGNQPDNA